MRPDSTTRPLFQQTVEARAALRRDVPGGMATIASAVCDTTDISRCEQCGAHLEDQRQITCESCQSMPPNLGQDDGDGSDDGTA